MKRPFDPKQLPEAVGNASVRIWRAASRRKRVLVVCRTRVVRDSFLDDEHYEVNWSVKGYETRQTDFSVDWRAGRSDSGRLLFPLSVRFGGFVMGLLSDIERLNRELDERPGDQLLRFMLADALEESAGAVGCPECLGTGRINYGLADGDCGGCSGTGRVSSTGCREMAEGYKVLAQLDRVPFLLWWPAAGKQNWFWSNWTSKSGDSARQPAGRGDQSSIPGRWLARIGSLSGMPGHKCSGHFPSRREAEDRAARVWGEIPYEERAVLLTLTEAHVAWASEG